MAIHVLAEAKCNGLNAFDAGALLVGAALLFCLALVGTGAGASMHIAQEARTGT